MRPQASSPAVDAAGVSALTTDQRGQPRPLGAAADVGAFERNPSPVAVTVEQGADQVDPTDALPITFDVAFSEPVTGFDAADLTVSGSASATVSVAAAQGSSGDTYTVTIDDVTLGETVTLSIAADLVVGDWSGNNNAASTSVDNAVTYREPEPTTEPTTTEPTTAEPTTTAPSSAEPTSSEPTTSSSSATSGSRSSSDGATTTPPPSGGGALPSTGAGVGLAALGAIVAIGVGLALRRYAHR